MKELNNIYEALNYLDFNIDDYDKEELNEIEKRKIKKQFRKSRRKLYNFRRMGSMVATIILLVGILSQTSFMKNVYSYAGYKLTELYYSIEKLLNSESDLEPYSIIVNEVMESDGIEIKLTEAIVDEEQVIIAAIVDIGDKTYIPNLLEHEIYFNGEKAIRSSTNIQMEAINEDNTVFTYLFEFDIKNINISDKIDIRIVFRDMPFKHENGEEGIISDGVWEFEFTSSGDNLMSDTRTIPFKYLLEFQNVKLVFEKISYNAINQKINGRYEGIDLNDVDYLNYIYATRLIGEDNQGNRILFELDRISANKIEFKARRNYLGVEASMIFNEAEYIRLIPYIERNLDPFGHDYQEAGEEFTIYLGN